ncbi:MAG: hypothetical protein NTX42_04130 [Methanothrix sp.]|nr:hypothetical protein [Methanothrix sp.]
MWDEIIKKIGVILVLAVAMLSVHVMAQGIVGNGGVDILGKNGGIFETEGSAFKFQERQDTNIGSLTVGNDKALAIGHIWQKKSITTATNNLEIKKNQYSGNCSPCEGTPCRDSCTKVNIETIKAGNREAMAYGPASAANYIKIVTNQQ